MAVLSLAVLFTLGKLPFPEPFDTRLTAAEVFESAFGEAVPPTVTDLQGAGEAWLDYTLYLRFRAEAVELSTILGKGGYGGWTPISWEEIGEKIAIQPAHQKHFRPPWAPASLSMKECYHRGSSLDDQYLVFERSSGICYFYGRGR